MRPQRILVVGSGGREHALAWRLARDPGGPEVLAAPGNEGMERVARRLPVGELDDAGLAEACRREAVDLVVVGPEAPLAAGLADRLEAAGVLVYGPGREAARLESSKWFAKEVMRAAGVPTAAAEPFEDVDAARRALGRRGPPWVVKADGLAAGKGVLVSSDRAEAEAFLEACLAGGRFGAGGRRVLIEEHLAGEEVSVMAVCDGRDWVLLPPARDYKRAFDGDRGPNTGGMGAYCPAPVVTDEMLRWIESHVLVPTVHAMKRKGTPFQGVLYAGLMVTRQGPKVLEYNVRFGDPECQPLLMRLKTDLADVLEAAADCRLDRIGGLEWDPRPAVCVVMASEGYPGSYAKGKPIRGLDEAANLPDVKVFHAGTALADGQVVTSGGRVLDVTALGDSIATAKRQAYTAVKCIRWEGAWCRKDISDKALG